MVWLWLVHHAHAHKKRHPWAWMSKHIVSRNLLYIREEDKFQAKLCLLATASNIFCFCSFTMAMIFPVLEYESHSHTLEAALVCILEAHMPQKASTQLEISSLYFFLRFLLLLLDYFLLFVVAVPTSHRVQAPAFAFLARFVLIWRRIFFWL
jgi:hypothetical protein